MGHIGIVLGFGWHYLRRYWPRLLAGVLFGVLFGLTNASFVWATKTLMERFEENPAPKPTVSTEVPAGFGNVTENLAVQAEQLQGKVEQWVDRWLPRVGHEMDWRQLLGALLLLPVLVGIRGATDYLSSYCMGWVSERVINDMRIDVLAKLNSLSLDFFTRSASGDLLTRINSDTAKLLRCLRAGAADLIKEPISLVSVLIALLLIDWKLTLLAMITLPLCLFPLLVLGKKVRKASKASRDAEVLQSSQLVELLGAVRILKAYNLEDIELARFRKASKQLVHHGMKGIQAKQLVNPIIEVISMLGLGVLIVYIFKTQTSAGDFVGFLTGLMLFFLPVKKLASVHVQFEQASVGVQRLSDILRETPTVREPENPATLEAFEKEIRFDRVTFAYTDRTVLDRFDLTVRRGEHIGIAGPSGSGKSTLVNLLFRFYDPTDGRITIDNVDLRDVRFVDLRRLMALVSQDIVLFDQTVAENIACGRSDASRAEIEQAARAAYAHDFIAQLPNGYDSRVGERGVTLSGGQRQRIAIARAFVRNAPILVLDEATASLDSEAEAEVQKAIDKLSENRTVIVVAHRLSTLANTSRVLVLSAGRIVEQGSYEELLARDGAFAAMARRQGIVRNYSAANIS